MKTSDRSPKANAYGLMIGGFAALAAAAIVQNVVLAVVGIVALVGSSHYLKVATDQAKEPQPPAD